MILGIDIGGTRIKTGLVNRTGEVLRSARIDTPRTLEQFRRDLDSLIRPLMADVDGAGIGCKGLIDPESTEVIALPGTVNYLEGHRLSSFLPEGLAVVADNDARVALAGEVAWGAARGMKNALMLTLGTGVGGGILAEGRIVRGARGIAGHLGHYTARTDGPLCICGNRGCIETLFSAKAIESEAAAMVHRGIVTRVRPGASCADVFDAAAQGDPPARRILDRAIRALGGMIAGLIFIFDPEAVIIGGQISSAGQALFEPLSREIHDRTDSYVRRRVPLIPAQLSGESGVAGAAALFLTLQSR